MVAGRRTVDEPAIKALLYELTRLVEAAVRVPDAPEGSDYELVVRHDLMLESFLVHLRNLLEFVNGRRRKDAETGRKVRHWSSNGVCAVDFNPQWHVPDRHTEADALIHRIDKHLLTSVVAPRQNNAALGRLHGGPRCSRQGGPGRGRNPCRSPRVPIPQAASSRV